jgi:hypothetical protein
MRTTSIAITAILGSVSADPRNLIVIKWKVFCHGFLFAPAPAAHTPEEVVTLENATITRSVDPTLEASSELADLSGSVNVLAEDDVNKEVSSAGGTIFSGVALTTSVVGALALF